MSYFSERELGAKPCTLESISIPVWNGLVTIIQSFISNNALSKQFPLQCPDNIGICGCDEVMLNDKIKAIIPEITTPISRMVERTSTPFDLDDNNEEELNTYAILDLIEFTYKNLSDPILFGKVHEFFGHYHLKFTEEGINKKNFQEQVNELFQRNGVAFILENNGCIYRILPESIESIVRKKITTVDSRLNELLQESTQNILLPKIADRIKAIERIWDAFERLKTYYSDNKKTSIEKIITELSNSNALFESELNAECKALTTIGNTYQIRHFEKDKQQITCLEHIDYFYFRMYSFINLFLQKVK